MSGVAMPAGYRSLALAARMGLASFWWGVSIGKKPDQAEDSPALIEETHSLWRKRHARSGGKTRRVFLPRPPADPCGNIGRSAPDAGQEPIRAGCRTDTHPAMGGVLP